MTKTVTRFFTVADYIEEEAWLREMHNQGWKLSVMTPPVLYTFESCEPEDVIYRLDFRNNEQKDGYFEMMSDFGWEYAGKCMGWNYFRKPADAVASEEDAELFSDNASKLEMVSDVIKKRMIPLLVIFLCVIVPNCLKFSNTGYLEAVDKFFGGVFGGLFVVYSVLLIHCGTKLKKIKKELEM